MRRAVSVPELLGGQGEPGPAELWEVRCPVCGLELPVDHAQVHGRAQISCPECPYVDTVRIFTEDP